MVTEGPAEVLHGRRVEREALGRVLDAVRGGRSRVLVVSGEPGIGKTALVESAIGSAAGFRVALVFVTREPGDELAGFQELVVNGLRNGDARALLVSALSVPLDERVRERIVAETRGNPLALLELPRGLTPAELAGGFGLPDAPGLAGRIEDSFQRRLAELPAETQRLLLVAAAEPVGDPVLMWRAAGRLGIGVQGAGETDGLLAIGTRVAVRHPLVRSSVYRS